MRNKTILLTLLFAASLSMSAQTVKVKVAKAGTLASLMAGNTDVERLKLSGTLNDADLAFVRSLPRLKALNLRSVKNEMFGDSAFCGMTQLENVRLPRNLRFIGKAALAGCTRLEICEMSGHLVRIPDSMFTGCVKLDKILLPKKLEVIGERAFMKSGVRFVIMPKFLTRIEAMAFYDCQRIEWLKIPEKVNYIGSLAFANCTRIRLLNLRPFVPPVVEEDAFANVYGCKLHAKYPEFYRTREPWRTFAFEATEENYKELQPHSVPYYMEGFDLK